ncbi:MAG: hypothetical protein EU981_04320 [Candidatus Liberibacter ctenarytainae]|uniref:Uncharacterized protein n=1 Tax=Candidatus Liberibacter ctenarytainae TaxID=2020335 RepID=A0A937DHB9_9HYPH|nr:hypothetical protein [Candidatus Liberibacter ctenarytainae]
MIQNNFAEIHQKIDTNSSKVQFVETLALIVEKVGEHFDSSGNLILRATKKNPNPATTIKDQDDKDIFPLFMRDAQLNIGIMSAGSENI